MLGYLKDRKEKEDGRPFFAYFPFTAPHWPLQAPDEYIAHYKGVYDEGPDVLRQQRLQKMKDMGLCAKDVVPHPVVADEVKVWDDMTLDEKAKSCKQNLGRECQRLQSAILPYRRCLRHCLDTGSLRSPT